MDELKDSDYIQNAQEAARLQQEDQREIERLQTALDNALRKQLEFREMVSNSENTIREYQNDINQLEKELESVDVEYFDVMSLQAAIEAHTFYLSMEKEHLAEYRQGREKATQQVSAARTELEAFQPKATEIQAKVDEAEREAARIEAEIANNQSVCDNIPYENIQSDIQRFEDSKETYRAAREPRMKKRKSRPLKRSAKFIDKRQFSEISIHFFAWRL